MYLATDCRHGSSDCSKTKHGNGHDEANDLDERHPVSEERTTHRPHRHLVRPIQTQRRQWNADNIQLWRNHQKWFVTRSLMSTSEIPVYKSFQRAHYSQGLANYCRKKCVGSKPIGPQDERAICIADAPVSPKRRSLLVNVQQRNN